MINWKSLIIKIRFVIGDLIVTVISYGYGKANIKLKNQRVSYGILKLS